MSSILVDQQLEAIEEVDAGDPGRFAHWVFPKSVLMEALIEGTPVTAICGYTWVPSRDPDKYPRCPKCQEIYDAIFNPEG